MAGLSGWSVMMVEVVGLGVDAFVSLFLRGPACHSLGFRRDAAIGQSSAWDAYHLRSMRQLKLTGAG